MGGRALMAPPTTGAQVVACAKEFEKGLGYAFVDVEEGAQGGIESFDGAGGAMPVIEEPLDGIEQFIRLGTKQLGEMGECTGQLAGHVGALSGSPMTLDVTHQAPNQCSQEHRSHWVGR